MEVNKLDHDETHERMIRSLVEDGLTGEERAQAERSLLACAACLEEYNWYRGVWRSLADPEGFRRWAARLGEKDPEWFKLYGVAVEKLAEYQGPREAHAPPAGSGYWVSAAFWRKLALASAATVLVGLAIAAYKVVTLQKAMQSQAAHYQKLLDDKKGQTTGPGPEAEALRQKVEELTTQTQTQAQQMAELSQRLERYAQPRTNAVLFVPFLATREPVLAQEISLPEGKLFLNLHLRPPEEKEYKIYSLIVKDPRGNALWRDDQVKKDEEGNIDLLVERSFLKPGEYVLEIYGLRGRSPDLLSQTRFKIRGR